MNDRDVFAVHHYDYVYDYCVCYYFSCLSVYCDWRCCIIILSLRHVILIIAFNRKTFNCPLSNSTSNSIRKKYTLLSYYDQQLHSILYYDLLNM